ncbi:hypothetical protein COLO4_13521 [Corchorus olitorius]|uniref:Uncharacterized protein n=1 Tax=Corchorus olitorius TaxID=93759 RepID=A0A1R3JW90_9ROSI|nr:hypothetical protein COLO4_13521 [Corchorus olitorius]
MVKIRVNTADVAAEISWLRSLIRIRCSDVCDLNKKLSNSSGITESGESEKDFLLMESGVCFHTTAYARDKSNTPSEYNVMNLLRSHRDDDKGDDEATRIRDDDKGDDEATRLRSLVSPYTQLNVTTQ